MKQLIISALVAMMFASCTQSYNINGQYYDLGRLQETGVDSVIVAHDPSFHDLDSSKSVVMFCPPDGTGECLYLKIGTSNGQTTRYYLAE